MTWPTKFEDRLRCWADLRAQIVPMHIQQALEKINSWWHQTPWRPYYLHWDDQDTWPDPWQLLSDDVYCPVARALGMFYTINMLDRADLSDAKLVLTTSGDNLVLVSKTKYILNWSPDSVVNTFQEVKITRSLSNNK